jgi:AraC family transcriptional regulator
LAKIALELERALARRAELGTRGTMADRLLAQGEGWSVRDVVCTAGPLDRPFEELHSSVTSPLSPWAPLSIGPGRVRN